MKRSFPCHPDPGALHAATNPDATEKRRKFELPIAYDPDVDRLSKAAAAASLFTGDFR